MRTTRTERLGASSNALAEDGKKIDKVLALLPAETIADVRAKLAGQASLEEFVREAINLGIGDNLRDIAPTSPKEVRAELQTALATVAQERTAPIQVEAKTGWIKRNFSGERTPLSWINTNFSGRSNGKSTEEETA